MSEDTLYSTKANEIAEDASIDTDTALRQLMAIQIDMLENMMVALWEIEDSLTMRTTKKPDA